MSEKEVMAWGDLGTGARDLAQMVADDNWVPDMILGIASLAFTGESRIAALASRGKPVSPVGPLLVCCR